MKNKVKLAYCLVDGKIHHVSDFAHLTPKSRPPAKCPICNREVVLRLGKNEKPAHHAAHKPDSNCPVRNTETALHYNCKLHIYIQLQKMSKLYLHQFCNGWTAPTVRNIKGGGVHCFTRQSTKYLWQCDWDEVKLEASLGRIKPDIILYKNKAPIAAIEICATNPVSEEKVKEYLHLGIPWIEVEADESIYEEWSNSLPLPTKQISLPLPQWTCEGCVEAPERYAQETENKLEEKARLEQANKIKEYEQEQNSLNYLTAENQVILAKAVAFYRYAPFGPNFFKVLVMERYENVNSTEVLELYLKINDVIWHTEEAPITKESKDRIKEAYREWISDNRKIYSLEVIISDWTNYFEMLEKYDEWNSPYHWDEKQYCWVHSE